MEINNSNGGIGSYYFPNMATALADSQQSHADDAADICFYTGLQAVYKNALG
jgi:hypothetical protein